MVLCVESFTHFFPVLLRGSLKFKNQYEQQPGSVHLMVQLFGCFATFSLVSLFNRNANTSSSKDKIRSLMLHFDCFADIFFRAAQGLIFKPNAYLSSNWNRMDSVVLLFAWIDELGMFESGSSAKVR